MPKNEPSDDILRELYMTFLDKRPVSRRISTAFVEKYLKGRNGEIRSWDKVFGKPARYGTGKNIKREMEQGQFVADWQRRSRHNLTF